MHNNSGVSTSSQFVFLNKFVTNTSTLSIPEEPNTGASPESPAINVDIDQKTVRIQVTNDRIAPNIFFLSRIDHGKLVSLKYFP